LLRDDSGLDYEGRRAQAFALALGGRADKALRELNEGWADDWPPPSAYALDVSRIHFLAGECERALSALRLETCTRGPWEGVGELVVGCVRRDPALWRRGFGIALSAESGSLRLRTLAAIVRARLAGRDPDPAPLPGASPGS